LRAYIWSAGANNHIQDHDQHGADALHRFDYNSAGQPPCFDPDDKISHGKEYLVFS
jgi:hypothetical protein